MVQDETCDYTSGELGHHCPLPRSLLGHCMVGNVIQGITAMVGLI